MTWSKFDVVAAIVTALSLIQFIFSVTIMQAMDFGQTQISICVVAGFGFLLIGMAALLQNENDHRFLWERRWLLILYYGITIERFLIYGCEKPEKDWVAIGLARLIIAYVEAFLALPVYALAVRQRSRTSMPSLVEVEMRTNPSVAIRQRIVPDTAEDSMQTISLTSHKNE